MKNEIRKELDEQIFGQYSLLAVLVFLVIAVSIKPMYLYATDKQAYYQNELDNIEQVEKDKNEQFRSGKLGVSAYFSSMELVILKERELKSQINKYNNI